MADQDHSGTDGELILGIYRLVERFGGALGPLLVAGLVASLGLQASMAVLATMLVLGSIVTGLGLSEARPGERTGAPGGPQ
jgi:MFS-type transporter involved in bile tolerance (Atg22 family)